MLNYLEVPDYNPAGLIEGVMQIMGFRTATELAYALGRDPWRLYKLKGKKENLTKSWLLDFHDLTGYSAEKLREMAGIQYELYEKMKEEDKLL